MSSRGELWDRAREAAGDFAALAADIESGGPLTVLPTLEMSSSSWETDKAQFRRKVIAEAARGEISGDDLDRALDGARWLRRLVYHAWRMAFYWEQVERRNVGGGD